MVLGPLQRNDEEIKGASQMLHDIAIFNPKPVALNTQQQIEQLCCACIYANARLYEISKQRT